MGRKRREVPSRGNTTKWYSHTGIKVSGCKKCPAWQGKRIGCIYGAEYSGVDCYTRIHNRRLLIIGEGL